MPTLDELTGLGPLLQFVAWCLVVWALAHIVFRSFPAAELWASRWMQPGQKKEIHILLWELRKGKRYDPRAEKGDPLVAVEKLSMKEMEDRQDRLERHRKRTIPTRLVTYVLGCVFCHHAWTAFILVLLCASWGSSWGAFWQTAVPATLAYCAATTIGLGMFSQPVQGRRDQGQPPQQPGGCGRHKG